MQPELSAEGTTAGAAERDHRKVKGGGKSDGIATVDHEEEKEFRGIRSKHLALSSTAQS